MTAANGATNARARAHERQRASARRAKRRSIEPLANAAHVRCVFARTRRRRRRPAIMTGRPLAFSLASPLLTAKMTDSEQTKRKAADQTSACKRVATSPAPARAHARMRVFRTRKSRRARAADMSSIAPVQTADRTYVRETIISNERRRSS